MHPRDRFVTIYGRKPVLEALLDSSLRVDKVLLAHRADGGLVARIVRAAAERGVELRRVAPKQVTRLSRNGRQDQGVAADIVAQRMRPLEAFLEAPPERATVMLLDGVTTPANVGMLLRTATAAGLDGVVLPRAGCPEVSPLVVKASAGVAFRAPILRTPNAPGAAQDLREAGFELVGLRADATATIFDFDWPARTALVMGNEATGVSELVAQHTTRWASIPMRIGVESLNVAIAGALAAYAATGR